MFPTKRIVYSFPPVTAAFKLLVLLGVILPGIAHADTFTVAAGDVYGQNGLIAAINAANDQTNHPGSNTIVLTRSTYTLTQRNNTLYGFTGLPIITSNVIIEGNGAILERSSTAGTPSFRLFTVAGPVTLTLPPTNRSHRAI